MPTDYATALVARLWQILEADTAPGGFTSLVEPKNRIKFDRAAQPVPYAGKGPGDPAAFPEVEIDLRDELWSAFIDDEVYGENAAYNPADAVHSAWLETTPITIAVTVTGRDTQLSPNGILVNVIQRDLRAAGPTLGVPWLARWGKLRRTDAVTSSGKYARGTWRRVTTLLIPFTVQVQGNLEL